MATKELSVAQKLKQLFELQTIDSKFDEIQILKGELPIEVSDLEDEIVGLETRIQKLRAQVADIEGEINRHDTNIKDSEANIIRYKKQLDNVKNNREYEALTKELENQSLEIELSHKRMKDGRVNLQAKIETLANTEKRLGQKEKDLSNKRIELSQIIEKTEKEEGDLGKRSDKAKEKIEERLLKAYTKIRSSYRNGLSVVTVDRDACGGCFNKIPAQLQLEIGLRKNIIACEHCGRILVDHDILNAENE